jgi:hypothetical protein
VILHNLSRLFVYLLELEEQDLALSALLEREVSMDLGS